MTNDELAEFIVAEVRQYVDTTLLRSIERLESSFAAQVERAVEERIKALPAPEPGPPGKNGADAVVDQVALVALVTAETAKAVAGIDLESLRGPPGRVGQDADPEMLKSMVAEAVAALPVPKDGKDADLDAIKVAVADAVAALPAPKNGEPGKDADPEVIRSEVAKAVAALPSPTPGRDGKDADVLVIKALVAGEVAHAVAALPTPKDGAPGKDGITVEQLENATLKALAAALEEIQLDGRNLMLGDRVIKTLPIPLYRKVYQPDTDYEPGDFVTFGGDVWHCNTATRDKPGTSDAWTLAIKKGRDFRPPDRGKPGQGPVKQ